VPDDAEVEAATKAAGAEEALAGETGAGVSAAEAGPTRRSRVRPPSRRWLEREQEIYEVAAEIFHKKGYAGTTLQDIADAVGLLKGSLYYYIDSKEDLLYRITQVIHGNARAILDETRALDGTPCEKLYALVKGHVLSFGARLTFIRVFYTEYAALTGERREEIMGERRQYAGYVDELIAAGQADGSFCPDHHVRIVRNAILTMINSVYLWYRPGHDEPIEAVATAYANYTIAGLRCPPEHDHGGEGAAGASGAMGRRGQVDRQPLVR
jgi:AcrR family transcriptional regulator